MQAVSMNAPGSVVPDLGYFIFLAGVFILEQTEAVGKYAGSSC